MLIIVGIKVFRKVTVVFVSMMLLTMIVMMGMVLTVGTVGVGLLIPISVLMMGPGPVLELVLMYPRVTDPPRCVLGEVNPVIVVRNPGEYPWQPRLTQGSDERTNVLDNNECPTLQLSAPLDTRPMSWGPVLLL